jgi:hypothetical protein
MASIAAPNFSGYIHKLQVKEIVRQAKIMEDELAALTARQYAEFGFMPSVTSNGLNVNGSALALGAGSEAVDPKNYVMLNRVNGGAYGYCSGYGVGAVEYVTLANVQTGRAGGSNTPSELAKLRQSAGLTEFYKQTGIDLSGNAERTPGPSTNNGNSEVERRWYALQFYPRSDIATGTTAPFLTTRYLHPDQSYFAFYEVKYNDTWYMVMHNAKYSSASATTWVANGVVADPGKWNVYKNSNPADFVYDNTSGKPFGVISD